MSTIKYLKYRGEKTMNTYEVKFPIQDNTNLFQSIKKLGHTNVSTQRYRYTFQIQNNEQKNFIKEGTNIMKKNFIKALETLQAQATTNPADITSVLRKWQLAENYEATAISNHSNISNRLYKDIDAIYTRYADIRTDDNVNYYSVDEAPHLTALRLLGESLDCTGISRVALLDCLATYWYDLKWIPETYDILIALAGSLKYYEEQIPEYTQIASNLMAEAILTCDLTSERMR